MTIDEAIECEKRKSEHAKEEYLMLQDDNWTDVETYEKRLNNCANYAEYHNQIAEWLEELKFLRTTKETMYREVYNKGRADALDEFWKEFDKQIKTIGRQAYYYTDFLVIGMKIREQMKEQNNGRMD